MSAAFDSTLTVLGLLAPHAHATPDAPAIGAPGRAFLSHAGLVDHVRAVASRLNELGIGRGQCVAVVLPNGPEMATAFLAVSSAASVAPLNPAYREAEFDFFLGDLSPAALMVQRGLPSPARAIAAQRKIPILELDVAPGAPAGAFTLSGDAVGPRRETGLAEPEDVAMILHTSGTTSRPKIVPLKHKNLAFSARNIAKTIALTPRDRCLNVMPLYHIHGLMAATLASMAAGASTVCSPGFDASQFFAWFDVFRPTWYTAVPTIHQAVLAAAPQHAMLISENKLRFIRSSSAALPPPVMAELERVMGAPVIEGYGMTEASHQMASNPLPPGVRKPGMVGLPTGIDIAIMNEAGELLARGARGEIVIRGASVIDGYQSNPKANASSFTHGWFRTGDEGHLDEDGYLALSGRIKEIINKAGEKISPREIDELLMKHPAVSQAVAFALPHPTLGEDVGAAVVLKPGATADESELRQYCAASIAEFKTPQRVLVVAELPKGPTGKLKRIGLAEHFVEELAAAPYAAPRTPLEKQLAEVWASELKHERVGVHDNYFVLGGDSLQAVMLAARAKQVGIAFSPAELFANPTIAELSKALETAAPAAAAPAAAPDPKDVELIGAAARALDVAEARIDDAYPLTPFQLGLVAGYEPRFSVSALQTSWTVRGLDPLLMRRALASIARRHPTLRTGFAQVTKGSYAQFVLKDAEPIWVEHDLRGVSAADQGARLASLLAQEHCKPFTLAAPPLFRTVLVRLADDRAVLSCVFHHAVADLWSIALFEREWVAAYDALRAGNEPPEASPPPSFRTFVEAEAKDAAPGAASAFLRRELEGFSDTELSRFFRPSGAFVIPGSRRESVSHELSEVLVAKLAASSRSAAITPSTFFHGAWAIVAAARAETFDTLFGAVVSGRWGALAGLDRVVGPTMSTAPLRVRIPQGQRMSSFLQALQTKLAELQSRAHVSWDDIAKSLSPPRRSLPAWSTLIVENLPQELWERPSATLAFSDFAHHTHMRAPLMVSVFPFPKQHVKATFDPVYFAADDADRMVSALIDVLEAGASGDPDLASLHAAAVRRLRGDP